MTDQQSPKLTATEFVDLVVASGLLEREEVDRVMAAFPPADKGRTVARHLVDTGKLTRFQASRLLRGKSEGFQFGQYRILEELGRGGMGRVYKAVHQAMGRFVALKLLATDLTRTEKARTLFQREVKAAGRLHHPNIVTFYDANHAGDRHFLVMEFVDGPNLSQLVKERGPLPVEQACEYIRQAAIGLGYAHDMGLVHRDVKPANLLVQQTPGGPQVKILDFGLAIVTSDEAALSQSASTGVPGTPDYMAPEQAKDHLSVDGRADLYSLGCTFYYLLTGEVPFPGGTALEKVTRHGSEAPRAVQSLRPEVADAVATVVHKLLAKNPKWRYEKAADLAADLDNVLKGRRADWSAPARPPALPRRSEPLLNPGSGDDVWSEAGELDASSNSTMPSTMATRETPTSDHIRRRTGGRRRKPIWPWVVLAVVLAFGVVAGMGLVLKAIVERGAPGQ